MPVTRDTNAPSRSRIPLVIVLAAAALGLLARGISVAYAPRYSYLPDHLDNMAWSDWAFRHGPWRIYDCPEYQPVPVRLTDPRTGREVQTVQVAPHACNYPPGSAYLFWVQGALLHAFGGEPVEVRVPKRVRRRFPQMPAANRMPVVNTTAARFADGAVGIAFDYVLAWGVAALVLSLAPGHRLAAASAFAVTLLAPPIFLDSAFWNQADAWVAAPMVWTLVWLVRGRLVLAGLVYGLGLLIKAQAILLAPVLSFVLLALRFMPGGSWRRLLAFWRFVAAMLAAVAFVVAPFMWTDRGQSEHGAWRWLHRGYVSPLKAEAYARTTMNAFNVWWFDYLHETQDRTQRRDPASYSDAQRLAGLSKNLWGKLLLAAGILTSFALCAWRVRWQPESWVVLSFLVLFCTFLLPTRAHERYIYFCIPFAIALAVLRKSWIPVLAVLLVTGTAEMTSFRWVRIGRPAVRSLSGLLAALNLVALLAAWAWTLLHRATPAEASTRTRRGRR